MQPTYPPPPPVSKKRANVIIWVAAGVIALCSICGITAILSSDKDDAVNDQGRAITTAEPADRTTQQATAPAEGPAPQQPTEEPPAPPPALTVSQENAIETAQSYLRYTSFSRQGLIDQLVFEQFSVEDATFAVDYLNVDWNEQAAKKAQSYLDYSSFSRQGLIDQLIFEGFTPEQAEYGVTAVGL